MNVDSAQEIGRNLVELNLLSREQLSEALEKLADSSPNTLLKHLERQAILTPYQIQKLENGDRTGYFLGRFKVMYKISAGTFARVYRGVDSLTGASVAIKVLRSRHTLDPENIKQFHREARLTAGFNHPNIARQLEVGMDSNTNQHYIAMEFVEGGNLREFLRIRKRIEPHELSRLGLEMAEGLRYALSKGITHRDVKPTNILISSSGQVKWVDFGVAGLVESSRSGTTFSTEQRTVDYAGLEKATGAAKGDPRSDIFFLGAVFAELLTGEPPLAMTKDKNARMQKTRFDRLPLLSENPTVPTELAKVIDRMMAFRPEARYQDYDAIIRDLQSLQVTTEIPSLDGAPPPSSEKRLLIVHRNARIQDILRKHFTDAGYKVVLTVDIHRAVSLFGFRPANCLIIDLETTGEEGVKQFLALRKRPEHLGGRCTAVFMASPEQSAWTSGLSPAEAVVLSKPLKLGDVVHAVNEFVSPSPRS